jgi:hypothetical protein
MSRFRSPTEFVEVFEKLWTLIDRDPDIGEPLALAQAPHRFEITDLGLEFNVTWADPQRHDPERNLVWTWGREHCDWEPLVTLRMDSDTANRYFQGKENLVLATTLGRVKVSGPIATMLKLAPLMRPIEEPYRAMLAADGYDHLLV